MLYLVKEDEKFDRQVYKSLQLNSLRIDRTHYECACRLACTVASRGSVLYFLVVKMGLVNEMYQTSLRQFLQIFDISMVHSAKSPFTAKRILNIIDYLTYLTFSYTTRGYYEKDKFLYTILMTLEIQMQAKTVSPEEFQCFIKGAREICQRMQKCFFHTRRF